MDQSTVNASLIHAVYVLHTTIVGWATSNYTVVTYDHKYVVVLCLPSTYMQAVGGIRC